MHQYLHIENISKLVWIINISLVSFQICVMVVMQNLFYEIINTISLRDVKLIFQMNIRIWFDWEGIYKCAIFFNPKNPSNTIILTNFPFPKYRKLDTSMLTFVWSNFASNYLLCLIKKKCKLLYLISFCSYAVWQHNSSIKYSSMLYMNSSLYSQIGSKDFSSTIFTDKHSNFLLLTF